MDAYEYENLVCAMFNDAGWSAYVCGGTGDHGVDIVAKKGREVVLVQCKHYSSAVGEPIVRELFGVLCGEMVSADVVGKHVGAMLVTPIGYTNEAMVWADSKPALALMTTRDLSAFLKVPIPTEAPEMGYNAHWGNPHDTPPSECAKAAATGFLSGCGYALCMNSAGMLGVILFVVFFGGCAMLLLSGLTASY